MIVALKLGPKTEGSRRCAYLCSTGMHLPVVLAFGANSDKGKQYESFQPDLHPGSFDRHSVVSLKMAHYGLLEENPFISTFTGLDAESMF